MTADCPQAKYPQLCPAHGSVGAVCAAPYHDCASSIQCGDKIRIVDAEETATCQFSNYSAPKGNKCPTSRQPVRTKFCPGSANAGPDCYEPNADCSTATICNGISIVCPLGTKVDCQYPNCTVVNGKCPTVGFPWSTKFCPALGGLGPDCYPDGTDCSTVIYCAKENSIGYCTPGKKWDCATSQCK
jgi:hypothetical protein